MDFADDLATTLGITPDRTKEAMGRSARRALTAAGGALLAGGGAAGGAAVAGRKSVAERRIQTPGGFIHAIGERRYVKDMAEAAQKKNLHKIVSTAQKLVSATFHPQQKHAESEKQAVSIKSLAPAAKAVGLGTAGALTGAASIYGVMKGRDFAVMDTPMGTLGGRKKDLKNLIRAARKGNREKFREKLRQVAPMHPIVTYAVRSRGKQSELERVTQLISEYERIKEAAMTGNLDGLTDTELEKLAAWWSFIPRLGKALVSGGRAGSAAMKATKGLKGLTLGRRLTHAGRAGVHAGKGVAAGKFAPMTRGQIPEMTKAIRARAVKAQRSASGKALAARRTAAKTAPAGAPAHAAAVTSPAAGKKKWLTPAQKAWLGVGALGAGTFWLGGKALGEAGKTMRAGSEAPGGGSMQQFRYS